MQTVKTSKEEEIIWLDLCVLKKNESIIIALLKNKPPGSGGFAGKFPKHLGKIYTCFSRLFPKIEAEGIYRRLFYEASKHHAHAKSAKDAQTRIRRGHPQKPTESTMPSRARRFHPHEAKRTSGNR